MMISCRWRPTLAVFSRYTPRRVKSLVEGEGGCGSAAASPVARQSAARTAVMPMCLPRGIVGPRDLSSDGLLLPWIHMTSHVLVTAGAHGDEPHRHPGQL